MRMTIAEYRQLQTDLAKADDDYDRDFAGDRLDPDADFEAWQEMDRRRAELHKLRTKIEKAEIMAGVGTIVGLNFDDVLRLRLHVVPGDHDDLRGGTLGIDSTLGRAVRNQRKGAALRFVLPDGTDEQGLTVTDVRPFSEGAKLGADTEQGSS